MELSTLNSKIPPCYPLTLGGIVGGSRPIVAIIVVGYVDMNRRESHPSLNINKKINNKKEERKKKKRRVKDKS